MVNSLEPKVTPFSIRVPRTFCEQTENTKWNSSNRGSTVASRRRRLGDCRSGLIRVDCPGLITSSRTFLARVSVSALLYFCYFFLELSRSGRSEECCVGKEGV